MQNKPCIHFPFAFLKEKWTMYKDTIAAIATSLSEAGIGIIRISGEEAIAVADKIFRTGKGRAILQKVESHIIHYGFIIENETVVDEVMVSVMRAPRSYTAEDTVEINCHGGVMMMQRILELVIQNGARLAEPGEFTKRAFLNGRIDLTKAEAVMDVIHSQSELALEASVNQLQGSLTREIKKLREDILYEIAFIESALDDPEHISLDGYTDELSLKIEDCINRVEKLLSTARSGRFIKEGINTVILGKPNVGKSSLMNLMVREERAIVTDVAGTTRDVLQESVRIHGISLNVIDTAGIRHTDDIVEQIGVEKARKYAAEADLILYVADGATPLDNNDREIMELLHGKNTIILLNKSDLECIVEEKEFPADIRVIRTSTKNNMGIEELEEAIKEMFFQGSIKTNSEVVITNMRHKEALQDTLYSLQQVRNSVEACMPEDFYSIDLMSAYASLGAIIGEEVGEDLVNEIFSKFCMGK